MMQTLTLFTNWPTEYMKDWIPTIAVNIRRHISHSKCITELLKFDKLNIMSSLDVCYYIVYTMHGEKKVIMTSSMWSGVKCEVHILHKCPKQNDTRLHERKEWKNFKNALTTHTFVGCFMDHLSQKQFNHLNSMDYNMWKYNVLAFQTLSHRYSIKEVLWQDAQGFIPLWSVLNPQLLAFIQPLKHVHKNLKN